MPIYLKRDSTNVPAEVQRWQYFLRLQGFSQTGNVDGQFGLKTETATKFFQIAHNLPVTGELDALTADAAQLEGYTLVPEDFYAHLTSADYPPRPELLRSPSSEARSAALGAFFFEQLPRDSRADPDEIVIRGSVDGTNDDWRRDNIISLSLTEPIFAAGYSGMITCHRLVAPHISSLFATWHQRGLLHLVRSYEGSFSPRYKRGKSPSDEGHGIKSSAKTASLSNHTFGSAFDINVADNPYGGQPALVPLRGEVREMVETANELGFYWGGHFSGSSRDGMHFEYAAF